ncbi:glycosyltransferase family 4 protein [Sphingomicrobium astaxanthinifaciens]|uniref:glycosyltransferase family 4 protein n=1 Tax=Sphingomicrobium astaxanthinifaciens TaxID=1227949 RepID=UPI001FCB11AF|nr:glycosyltransferase family 4 protein [Sphingomicrobium astaxanthinifaciens]MCJ7420510.1 glycosyltransferase family 4 protein [Sphingomicrobium astaxanthinifaciens]
MRLINILEDRAEGGVLASMGIFEHPLLLHRPEVSARCLTTKFRTAPRLAGDLLVTNMPPSWARMGFFRTLGRRNPHARWVHVEHSYTRAFERRLVANRPRFRSMLTLALGRAFRIVCVSHAQRDWLVEASGLPSDRFRIIHPWTGRDELGELPLPRRPRGAPLRIGAIGRFDGAKNFDELILAFGHLASRRFELHLGGFGPRAPCLAALADRVPNVHLHGKVTDLRAFFADVDALVIPSRHESFGAVATEARLAGRPILVADVDGLVEQARQGGMVAEMGDAAQIARAIEQFAQRPLDKLAAAARASVRGFEQRVVEGWDGIFSEAA